MNLYFVRKKEVNGSRQRRTRSGYVFVHKRGFTLVELLVVIAIIGVLVALLLPAVQAAREAARRMTCSNNMKQIGLAFQNHHSAFGKIPWGSSAFGYDTDKDQSEGTWVLALLPYMEQQVLRDQFAPDAPMADPLNEEVVQTIVSALICPSDTQASEPILQNRRQNPGAPIWRNPETALGLWYTGSMGPTAPDLCEFFGNPIPGPNNPTCQGSSFGTFRSVNIPGGGPACVGMLCRTRHAVSFRQVTDGLSNTILAGETLPGHTIWNCAFCPNWPVTSTHIPINIMEADEGVANFYWRTSGYKSLHPGGVYLLFGDGSVHFVNETIDHLLYNALGTKAGDETASLEGGG